MKIRFIFYLLIFSVIFSSEEYSELSLKHKIAQMIMIRVDGNFYNSTDWTRKNIKTLIKDRKVGGVITFGGNIHGTSKNLNEWQELSEIPLFVAADYERGLGQWIGGTLFPTNMAVAATEKSEYAYQQGKVIAKEASSIGVNMIFAPVMDINNNIDNPIINFRSYSDDVNTVSEFGISFINGIQEGGLIACAKHYPGHGDTNIDSHTSLPIIDKTREELFSTEFVPFKDAVNAGVKSIMVGHIVLPSIDSNNLPATHSNEITEKILRDDWNFKGLIITDALEMGALNKNTWEGESAIRAIEAGADIILLPKNTTRAINAIYEAVQNGRISEERILLSFNRIIEEKKRLGLFDNALNSWNDISDNIGIVAHKNLSKKISKESITLVKDQNNLIPINSNKYNKVTHIQLSTDDDTKTKLKLFSKNIKSTHGNVDEIFINNKLSDLGIKDVINKIKNTDLIIVSMLIRISMDKGQSTIDSTHEELLDEIGKLNIPSISISFGSPYLPSYTNLETYLCTYGYGSVTLKAASDAIFGRASITGKLPVNLNEKYKKGWGLEYVYDTSIPYNNNKLFFPKAWDVIETAINDSIFPGAQIIIAHNDSIVAEKNFGFLSYDNNARKVDNSTIYDVASLTKVLVTTPVVMKLINQNKLDLSLPLSQFYYNLSSDMEDVTLYDLLTHSAGFKPYIEYYKSNVIDTREKIIEDILSQQLIFTPGTDTKYSDLGIILLMDIIEKVSSKSIDRIVKSWFLNPMNMTRTMYNPPDKLANIIAPTEFDDYFRNKLLLGTVHDENAYILGGVSSHAGIFSNANDILRMSLMFMNKGIYKGYRYLDKDIVEDFILRQFPEYDSDRAIGFDTPSQNGKSSAGDYFSKNSFGHLGFTGTSMWIDPDSKIVVILLTNRVHPSREKGGMYGVRRNFHTEVMKVFKNKGLI